MNLVTIAHIHSDFADKFGIPRQSGLVPGLRATVVFEAAYRDPQALRGLEGFTHLWLIWGFSQLKQDKWSPTVRPPRLGGNQRLGVFATRSPYRPNPLGLSCVRLQGIEATTQQGTVLHVLGADLMDNTPIYDIKPYLPYTDSHPTACGGFAAAAPQPLLQVEVADKWLAVLPKASRDQLAGVLALDPRPAYQRNPARVYGLAFAGCEVTFSVDGDTLTVHEIARGHSALE